MAIAQVAEIWYNYEKYKFNNNILTQFICKNCFAETIN